VPVGGGPDDAAQTSSEPNPKKLTRNKNMKRIQGDRIAVLLAAAAAAAVAAAIITAEGTLLGGATGGGGSCARFSRSGRGGGGGGLAESAIFTQSGRTGEDR